LFSLLEVNYSSLFHALMRMMCSVMHEVDMICVGQGSALACFVSAFLGKHLQMQCKQDKG